MIMISAVWMFGHSSLQAASVDHEPVVPEAIGFGLLYDDMRDTIYVRTDGRHTSLSASDWDLPSLTHY